MSKACIGEDQPIRMKHPLMTPETKFLRNSQSHPGRRPGDNFAQSEVTLDNSVNPNYLAASPCPLKGTLRDRHGTLARVAMDAVASGGLARRTKRPQRTAKSCGPGAATVASIRAACAGRQR